MNPRLRRLMADHERIAHVCEQNSCLSLIEATGTPPERYVFELAVLGLVPKGDDSHEVGSAHRVEVFLPIDYPRRPPFCRMLTPVFHPNIDPQKICIGDHWSADQSLPQLIVHIAEMICYQSYNIKSPLNAKAAAWAEQNEQRLPLASADLTVGV